MSGLPIKPIDGTTVAVSVGATPSNCAALKTVGNAVRISNLGAAAARVFITSDPNLVVAGTPPTWPTGTTSANFGATVLPGDFIDYRVESVSGGILNLVSAWCPDGVSSTKLDLVNVVV